MLTAAKALSYESMKSLLQNQSELLEKNSFISILPPDLQAKEEVKKIWPGDSDRWMSTYFEDVRPEHMHLIPSLEEELGRRFSLFHDEQADRIIEFLSSCHSRQSNETLFVNCVAGVSRSGAIASFACEVFNMDKGNFKRANPTIQPNSLVLYLLRERWELRQKQQMEKTGSPK